MQDFLVKEWDLQYVHASLQVNVFSGRIYAEVVILCFMIVPRLISTVHPRPKYMKYVAI